MNTADIGFEREIWKAADKMRGNIDASEYKSVVLGLIFLKYISDRFEDKYNQLKRNTGSLSPRAKDSRRTRTNIRPKISSMSRPKPAGSGLRPRRTRPK